MKRKKVISLLACVVIAATANSLCAQEAVPVDAPYKNTSLSFEQRVADLIPRMTLIEKAQQMRSMVRADPRLGILAVDWWTEGIHGISRGGNATVFPQAVGMAAAWDPPMMQSIADAIADEARAKYDISAQGHYRGIIIWSPTINMARDPRWGRTEETYGEDPYLTGRLAVAFIKGLQGDDPKYLKTVATPKHFAVHSQETQRHDRSFDCPENIIRDYYLPAFHDAIVEGKATSIMTAFSGLNGVPDTANQWLMEDILRKEWGFQGAVASDWGAVSLLVNGHHYVNSEEEAVAAAVGAGIDVISDERDTTSATMGAVQHNLLKEEVLDRALARNLLLRFRLGMMDPPSLVPFTKIPATTVGSPAHIALALRAARESVVLLKNDPAPAGTGFDKLLPIDLRRLNSIAVIGPYADVLQYGNYAGTPTSPQLSVAKALRAAVGDRVVIRTAGPIDQAGAVRAAEAADMVVFVCGLNSQIEKEGVDRSTIKLPDDQQQMLDRVVKANPAVVALVEGGSPVGLQPMKDHVPAIMWVGYPGEQGGQAIAQTLLGQNNPAGRLPMTFYKGVEDLPTLDDYDITKGRTYMYLSKPAPFVFGHGLSYTTFTYKNLRVTSTSSSAGGRVEASVDVTNTGPMDGDEVVQLYVHEQKMPANAKRPIKQLKGFQRVSIPKGQTQNVKFTLAMSALGFWDVSKNAYVTDPGIYDILVGASSADIRMKAETPAK